ncbi:FimV/HubP family polar landmark protein [Shewanella acanthi]|uniref:FimV/HubP family polar landmark protein n=1 Tax=Shewanella acanthi TaxID=2864212 RepID=UPI001C65C1A6|nr:FimV/HubP family polar landmark protein [Shewanella acanthi]QYJ78483.1 fimbrial protein FimV [Shewanella acanthi]
MTNMTKSLGLFALVCTVLSCSAAVQAKVSHVSINTLMFELGKYPKMRLNVITDNQDITRLEFVVQQSSGEEKLMAEQLNRFLVLLTGVDDVTDPNARLSVREYRVDHWLEVKSLPLFELARSTADKAAGANAKVSSHATHSGKVSSQAAVKREPDILVTEAMITQSSSATTAGFSFPSEKTAVASDDAAKSIALENEAKQALATQASNTVNNDGQCRLNFKAEETLWRIANRYADDWQLNVYGAMLAIYDANPKAFFKHKISALKKDATLVCPSASILKRYPNADKAKAEFYARDARG